jgi:signal transduction histidine kinase/ligand-binding sensor domain-containing protein/DNA-binding response OmpR family regulator
VLWPQNAVRAQCEYVSRIKSLTQSDGLSSAKVNALLKDRRGFFWFGTLNGLNRYDGHTIQVFKHDADDPASINHDRVQTLFQDSQGNLWIGTNKGLCRYNHEDQTFSCISSMNQIGESSNVISIEEDADGNLWLGTSDGIRILPKGGDQLHRLKNQEPDPIKNTTIMRLMFDSSGDLWIGTWAEGTYKYNPEGGTFTKIAPEKYTDNPVFTTGHISDIEEGPDNSIWISTWDYGLVRISADMSEFTMYTHDNSDVHSLNGNRVKAIEFDHKGYLWIGMEESGLDRFEPQTGRFEHFFTEFQTTDIYEGVSVYSIFIDDESLLWLGFRNDGVRIMPLDPSDFKYYNPGNDPGYRVFGLAEDMEGLWLAVRGGVDFLDYQSDQIRHVALPNAETPLGMKMLNDRELLIGTYKGSVFAFDKKSGRFTEYDIFRSFTTEKQNKINCFHAESDNTIMVGTANGFFRFDRKAMTLQKVSQDWVHTILPIQDNTYLLVTFGRDIIRYYTSTGKYERIDTKVQGDIKSAAIVDNELYIGTDLGLYKYIEEEDTSVVYKNIFPYTSSQVNAIVKDYRGNVWFTANKSIVHFDPEHSKFRTFEVQEGVPDIRFRDEAGLRLKDGRIAFAGDGGLTLFNPGALDPRKNNAQLYFTRFLVFDREMKPNSKGSPLQKDISASKHVEVKYNQSILTFEFGLLSYRSIDKHHFRYRLDGFDDNWFDLGNRNSVTFTNLSPGDYELQVQAAGEGGFWGDVNTLKITVMPPIWQTWYAYLFYLVLAVAIMLLIRRFIIHAERLKSQYQMEHLKLENIQENAVRESNYSQMRLRFFTNISHEFRTPLTLILDPLEKYMRDNAKPDDAHLKLMFKNADRLRRLITQILDFRKLEAGDLKYEPSWGNIIGFCKDTAGLFTPMAQQRKIVYQIESNVESKTAWFDKDKLEKILINLLANAFNYTQKGRITFSAKIQNAQKIQSTIRPFENVDTDILLEIKVSDTGIGISRDDIEHIFDRYFHLRSQNTGQFKGTGIGLTLTREMVEMHQGVINVKSQPGKGSEFTVYIPLNTEAPAKEEETGILTEAEPEDEENINAQLVETDDNGKDGTKEDTKPATILFVDDNEDLREYMQVELGAEYRLVEAENGVEGLEKALNLIPDLIISDIMMPEKDGIELCKSLKSDQKTSHIPIILLTAHNTMMHKIEGFNIGADDYLTKPFSSDLLKARINNLLKTRSDLHNKFSKQLRLQPKDLDLSSMDERFLTKAMEVVEKHLNNTEFNADLFASEMFMSRVHLYRKLKALTNQSVSEFVRTARLKLAAQLIGDRVLTIKEAAYTVGFKDPKYFSKCFKQQFGIKPSDYYESLSQAEE